MIEKHTTGKLVTFKQLLPKNTVLKTSTAVVFKEIASFAVGSSPGRSPRRFELLSEAFNCSVPLVAHNCLESFISVINIFLSGTAASAASKSIQGANQDALNKNSDTIRPIHVGEITRRIVSMVAYSSVLSDANKLLVPPSRKFLLPVRANFKASVDSSTKQMIIENTVLLKIVFKNGLILVNKQIFENEVKTRLPSMYNPGGVLLRERKLT